jgi:hypothetical protein
VLALTLVVLDALIVSWHEAVAQPYSDEERGAMRSTIVFEEREVLEEAAGWWAFLVTGIGWLVFALLVFEWDYTTVYAISFLFGVIALTAAANEFVSIAVSTIGWKVAHGVLAVLFVIAGIWAGRAPARGLHDARSVDRVLPPGEGDLRRNRRLHDKGALRRLPAPAHGRHRRDRARLLGRRPVQGEDDPARDLRRGDRSHPRGYRALPRLTRLRGKRRSMAIA